MVVIPKAKAIGFQIAVFIEPFDMAERKEIDKITQLNTIQFSDYLEMGDEPAVQLDFSEDLQDLCSYYDLDSLANKISELLINNSNGWFDAEKGYGEFYLNESRIQIKTDPMLCWINFVIEAGCSSQKEVTRFLKSILLNIKVKFKFDLNYEKGGVDFGSR